MSTHRDVGRFEEWAPSYDRSRLQRIVFEPVHRTILEVASAERPVEAILDVGCGTGRLLRRAADLFPGTRLEGVDAAGEMVRAATAALPPDSRIVLRQAVAEDLPFEDLSFDLVFSSMTFHHWHDQDRGAAEIRRVLRPEGRWLLADFVPIGLLGLLPLGRFPKLSRLVPILDHAGLKLERRRRVPRLGGQVSVLTITRSGERQR